MAEAVSIARLTVGILGFAGQVSQGCRNLYAILDSIKDAADDFSLFLTEVKMFHSLLEPYQNALTEIDLVD